MSIQSHNLSAACSAPILSAAAISTSSALPDSPMNNVGHTMDVTTDSIQLAVDENMDDVKLTTGVVTNNVKHGGDETSDGGVAIDKEDIQCNK